MARMSYVIVKKSHRVLWWDILGGKSHKSSIMIGYSHTLMVGSHTSSVHNSTEGVWSKG